MEHDFAALFDLIGRELAVAFAGVGDAVVLAARNSDGLETTTRAVAAAGGQPMVVTDVVDEDSVGAMAAAVLDRFGRVDVLINNSGIGGPSGRLWELEQGDWLATFDVNVHGVFRVSRALLPSMVGQRSGSIIVIGSISGKGALFGRSAYATTKMALVGLTRTLHSRLDRAASEST